MPDVTAEAFPVDGRVLVQTSWADAPSVACARVIRVIDATLAEAPLRTYVYPCGGAGEYQHLSGGRAVFWDTEAPLDTPFHYRTEALSYPTIKQQIRDTFSRTVAAGSWGTSDSIDTYTLATTAADFSVSGGRGLQSNSAVGATRRAFVTGNWANPNQVAVASTPVTAATSPIAAGIMSRHNGVDTYYAAELLFNPAGTLSVRITEVTAGVEVVIAGPTATGLTYVPNELVALRFETTVNTLRAKAWKANTSEPAPWLVTTTDTSLILGGVGLRSRLDAGNTNGLPVAVAFDSWTAQVAPASYESASLTLASQGNFWLRDPVRPCNDRKLSLCFDPNVECTPGQGIFFGEMGSPETYQSNSVNLLPTNARRPVPLARQMRDADSQLTLVTRTFVDRDAVLATAQPGSPLLFQAPPAYGIPDRYMSVAPSINVNRPLPDHRYQPRVISLPFTTVDRPVGPTQGICGKRFGDLCSTYATWDAAAASGEAWSTLVTGTAVALGQRRWSDVQTDFTTWNGVFTSGKVWQQIRDRT